MYAEIIVPDDGSFIRSGLSDIFVDFYEIVVSLSMLDAIKSPSLCSSLAQAL